MCIYRTNTFVLLHFDYLRARNFFNKMAKQDEKKAETIVDVQQVYNNTEAFFDKNRKPLMIGLIAIAVAFAGFFGYQYGIKAPKEAKANDALMHAELWAEKDSMEWAFAGKDGLEGFESIAATYSGTKAGDRANFWCGVYHRDVKKDYATALEYFKKADFNDEAVGVEVTGCVGDMYIMQGNIEEGASWLDKAAKMANKSKSRDFTGPMYSLKAAKAYMELGKNDRAKSLLEYVVDNYDKKGGEYGEAEKLLAFLKAQS